MKEISRIDKFNDRIAMHLRCYRDILDDLDLKPSAAVEAFKLLTQDQRSAILLAYFIQMTRDADRMEKKLENK